MIGVPCHWYGNLPIVYFFPDLMRGMLRAMIHEMREDGATPLFLDNYGVGVEHNIQASTNAACFVDHVDRLWQSTGDDAVLRECYPAVKKTITWSVALKPGEKALACRERAWEAWPRTGGRFIVSLA